MDEQRKARIGRWAWRAGAAFVALVVIAWVIVDPPERHWRQMRARTLAIEAELRALPTTREPIVDTTSDDPAWKQYLLAVDAFRALPDRADVKSATQEAARATDPSGRDQRAKLLARFATELEAVERGTRSTDRGETVDWERGVSGRIPSLMSVRSFVELLIGAGIQEVESGRSEEGVEHWLVALQFARDFIGSPYQIVEIIGCTQMVSEPMLEYLERAGIADLSPASLDRVESALAKLDDSLGLEVPSLRSELALLATTLDQPGQKLGGVVLGNGSRIASWRFGFSWRIAFADAIDRSLDLVESIDWTSPATLQADLSRVDAEAERDENAIVQVVFPKVTLIFQARRATIVRLRSLRHALAIARGVTPLAPPIDPLGEPTTIHDDGETVQLTTTLDSQRPFVVTVRR